MRYVDDLIESNFRSLSQILQLSIGQKDIVEEDIRAALLAESLPLSENPYVHQLSQSSESFISKIMNSVDRDMLIIVKKILKSVRYAVVTYYNVVRTVPISQPA